jgi:hypothetical protein
MRNSAKLTLLAVLLSLLPATLIAEPAKAVLVSSGLELNLDASVAGSYNGTTWFDQSGGGFNATQVNSPTYNAADGSFTLNGTNQYFNLGNVKAKTTAFTLEVTFSPNSVSGTPALVSRQNTAVAGNYFIGISNSKVNHYVESSPWGLNGNSTITTNTKYVATMVYDSSKNITPYLNGTLNGTATNFAGSLFNNNINLQIGALLTSSSPSDFFSGKIYSVRMYNRALTASEIDQNYRATSNYVLSNASSTTICNWPSNGPYGILFTAGTTSTIKRMRVQYDGATSNSNFFLNRLQVYADSSGAMGSLLGTMTPDTISASSTLAGASIATRVGQYVGTIPVTGGSRFWVKTFPGGAGISACVSRGFTTKSSGWAPVMSGSNFTLFNGSYITYGEFFIIEIEISDDNLFPTIGVPTISGAVTKGGSVTISVTSDSSGKVRFFLNGKRIAGCLSQATSGSAPTYSASCTWRPTIQGTQQITAQLFTGVQGATTPTSAPLNTFVNRRSTLR